MNRKRLVIALAAAIVLTAILAPAALAAGGSGSAGFSGGGGGSGGGHGSGFALYLIFDLLFHIALLGHGLGALVLIALALGFWFFTRVLPKMQAKAASRPSGPHKASKRERRVELAAAEAADEDADFGPEKVRQNATRLFMGIQSAWDRGDRQALRGLVAPELLVEWERRLDDFDRKGWHNHTEPIGEPKVEYVNLHRTGNEATDRVVVRIDARVKDYVTDSYGQHLKRTDSFSEITRIREFWTLGRRNGRWMLLSIEQAKEGAHALEDDIVATEWGDEKAMHDEAMLQGAVADAVPEGTKIAEVADLQFEGDAQAAAVDLSLADARFAPDVLEIAARRAVAGWAQAIDGDDGALRAVATPAVIRELLYAGDTSQTLRMVVRGPKVRRIRVAGLDAGAEPPTMTIEVDLSGARYIENRNTTAVVAGSRSKTTGFTERWTLSLTGDAQQPWQITAVAAPVGLI